MNVKLIKLTKDDIEHIRTIYKWNIAERRKDLYSCDELDTSGEYEKHMTFERFYPLIARTILSGQIDNYIIVDSETERVVGRLQAFGYNGRNKSIEIGYYFPPEFRGKGYGTSMMATLLNDFFSDEEMMLNKIIAETAEGNIASNKLLKKFGFNVDARMREHYWFDEEKQDQLIYSILRSDFIL